LPYNLPFSQTQNEYEPSSSQPLPYTQPFSQTHRENEPSSSQAPPQTHPQTQTQLTDLFVHQFEDFPENIQEEEDSNERNEDESLQPDADEEDEHHNRNEDEDIWENILSGTKPQQTQEAVPIRAAYCPPLHMRNLDIL